jgi:hypothetical protein
MSDGDTIRLTMTGKLSYDGDITIVQAAQIVTYLHTGTGLAPTSSSSPPASVDDRSGAAVPDRRQAGLSPRDALVSAGAKTNPEKIVAFALYVERQGDKDTFTLDDIRPLFRQARETAPGNLSRDLDAAIRSNWIAAASQKGEYYVTDVAADVLDSGFDSVRSGRSGGAKPKSTSARRQSRRTSIPTPEAFKDIDITTSIDGYINFHRIKTKTDKYLWAINAAKLWGVEALTNNEIIWLTDKLGVGLPSQDLGGYYRGNFKPGYVNRNTEGKIRVTPAGTQHLLSLGAGAGE